MFMKGKVLTAAVLSLFSLVFCAEASDDEEFDPVSVEVSRISGVIRPYARNTVSVEKIEDKSVITGPTFAWRLIYSRNYTPQTPMTIGNVNGSPSPEAIGSEKKLIDHADIILIDRKAGVKIDEMLKRNTVENPEGDGMFFKKYGLLWRNLPSNEYNNFVMYLGYDDKCHFFCSANISVIMTLKNSLKLEGGENVLPVLASALNARDVNDFTAKIAMVELKKIGPDSVPYIKKSVEDCLTVDNMPVMQIMTLLAINSPESDRALNDFAERSEYNLLQALFDTVIINKPTKKSLLNVYVSMLQHHAYILEAGLALQELGEKHILKTEMVKIAEKPRTVKEFIVSKRMIFVLAHPNEETSHKYLSDQIKLFAIRNGEVPNSIKFLNVNESEVERELRLSKSDRERLEPFEKALIGQPYPEFTLLYALDLCTFNTNAPRVDPEYIKRVRRSGRNVLSGLPFKLVEPALRTLIKYSQIPAEKKDLEALYAEIRKRSF